MELSNLCHQTFQMWILQISSMSNITDSNLFFYLIESKRKKGKMMFLLLLPSDWTCRNDVYYTAHERIGLIRIEMTQWTDNSMLLLVVDQQHIRNDITETNITKCTSFSPFKRACNKRPILAPWKLNITKSIWTRFYYFISRRYIWR